MLPVVAIVANLEDGTCPSGVMWIATACEQTPATDSSARACVVMRGVHIIKTECEGHGVHELTQRITYILPMTFLVLPVIVPGLLSNTGSL